MIRRMLCTSWISCSCQLHKINKDALHCNWGQNWPTHDKFTQIQPWFEGTIFKFIICMS